MEIQTYQLCALMQRIYDQQIQQLVTLNRTDHERALRPYFGIQAKLLAIKEQDDVEEKRVASKKKFLKAAKVSQMMSQLNAKCRTRDLCRSVQTLTTF